MKISTSDIKKLRDLTGAGYVDCKEALEENNSDFDKSIDYLRKKGISSAQKKGERSANDGLISINVNNTNKEAAIIEINSETDFVARNADFQDFVSNISSLNLEQKGDLEKLLNSKYDGNLKVSEALTNLVSKIGENISIKRCGYLEIKDGFVGTYIHNAENENMGKIGVIISVKTNVDFTKINDFLKKICMHIAATNPTCLSEKDLDQNILKKEKDFQLEEIKKSGKGEKILEKILEGKMKKFFNEIILLEQNFIVDESLKIKQYIDQTSKELNESIEIESFTRFKIGE